ncbi:MAG: polysaccharide deacetylase family protein, partial [Patescibacteria group bacterium]|nr:polysaccharide deacetylase family protein [Patescibacteria group bacterium]
MTFRIDDIGASSKRFEQHGRWRIGNFWFLKRLWPFKKWGPYKELTAGEWERILSVFEKQGIIPIVAITACWVEKDGSSIPFPEKFPQEAEILKRAFSTNKIIVANHGLTHCVVGKHLPKFAESNRRFHREFWPDLSRETHTGHVVKSQEILENFFEKPITIFVPPGNVWSKKTCEALQKNQH